MNSLNRKKLDKNAQRYLIFFIEQELYGLSIQHVQEIIALINMTKIPKTPSYIKGMINLRGAVMPVIDLRLKFNLQEKIPDLNSAIIISKIDNIYMGFVVDSVEDVIAIKKEQLQLTPDFGEHINTDFVEYIVEIEDKIVMTLNLAEIFASDELIDIKSLLQDSKVSLDADNSEDRTEI